MPGSRASPTAARAVLNLANVENLTVTGNRQPIANRSAFVQDSGTTGTRVVSGNDISATSAVPPLPTLLVACIGALFVIAALMTLSVARRRRPRR